ncbi:class I SAM-dependent methyltransferase [Puteibacter caeruleilacunae]|nr:class I SAM-dependent methyltransferase [Puteibacter caeruleilacunae]
MMRKWFHLSNITNMSLRNIYYSLSPKMRLYTRKLVYWPVDVIDGVRGRHRGMQPRKGDIYIGSGDFVKQGNLQVKLLKDHLDLQSSDTVLDIGSGIGRTAVPLTKFLSEEARYEGFDVVEKGVKWCRNHISLKFKNFNFTYVPLGNDLYNNSSTKATDFTFPYDDESFHKVFLFSVFTHMTIEEIAHYLREISRVMKADGKCLMTMFLYDEEKEDVTETVDGFKFPYKGDGYRLMSDKVVSANIAVAEQLLHEMVEKSGLQILNIVDGNWKIQEKNSNRYFQDIIVVGKK